MKKLILIAGLLLFPTANSWAEESKPLTISDWVRVVTGSPLEVIQYNEIKMLAGIYINPESLQKSSDGFIYYWTRVFSNVVEDSQEIVYFSYLQKTQCIAPKKTKPIDVLAYFTDGRTEQIEPGEWMYPPPNSGLDSLINFSCDYSEADFDTKRSYIICLTAKEDLENFLEIISPKRSKKYWKDCAK